MQAYVRHPELAAARANRDYVMKEVCNAVNTISGVAQATGQSKAHPFEGAGELAAALDEFDVSECHSLKQEAQIHSVTLVHVHYTHPHPHTESSPQSPLPHPHTQSPSTLPPPQSGWLFRNP